MIIEPKIRGFICTTAHPVGCATNVQRQIDHVVVKGALRQGPRRVLVSLGYSAWSEGQLESELGDNSWLTVDADSAVIFDTPVEQRYEKALGLLGLQVWMLSPQAGHA